VTSCAGANGFSRRMLLGVPTKAIGRDRRPLDRLPVAFVESKASQPDIAQLDWIALASPGCINDPPGDHFIDDRWLPLVVKLLASGIECFAQDTGSVVIKDDA
jgi:hypothetical protein